MSVDLHKLSFGTAYIALRCILKKLLMSDNPTPTLEIITGSGKHSQPYDLQEGHPVRKAANLVINELREQHNLQVIEHKAHLSLRVENKQAQLQTKHKHQHLHWPKKKPEVKSINSKKYAETLIVNALKDYKVDKEDEKQAITQLNMSLKNRHIPLSTHKEQQIHALLQDSLHRVYLKSPLCDNYHIRFKDDNNNAKSFSGNALKKILDDHKPTEDFANSASIQW